MRRNVFRPLWVILALLLLLEAWLWDHLEPIVARVVNLVPWGRLKVAVGRWIEGLPPYAALGVFVIPLIVVLPVKFLEVYFIATGNLFGTIVTLVLAKLLGLGVTAFVFDATRDKLLQIPWFHRMYDWFIWARDWAYAQTEPIRARIRKIVWMFRPERARRTFRRLMRLRRSYNRPSDVSVPSSERRVAPTGRAP
ncbi:MAG TPA: hypothetical protein VI077_07195 [Pseudolabrys sp.]|jgi:hypothetical protein